MYPLNCSHFREDGSRRILLPHQKKCVDLVEVSAFAKQKRVSSYAMGDWDKAARIGVVEEEVLVHSELL